MTVPADPSVQIEGAASYGLPPATEAACIIP